ncbi:MAG TPA: DUF4097 family beta strand repeat-containing protein [Bacillales bacterium]|nr:DUF4097 family beta strand repeat-containing protein [Bacillales bacterium]
MKKILGILLIFTGLVIALGVVVPDGATEWFSSNHPSQSDSVSVQGVRSIKIDGNSANVHVIPESRRNVMVKLRDGGNLTVRRSGNTVKIHVNNSWLSWIPIGDKPMVLDVHVPADYNQNMVFDLHWGNVQFYGKSAVDPMVLNQLRFDMNAGNVQLRNLKLQTLNQDGSAGNVNLHQVTAGKASFDISAGNLDLSHFKGQLDADISAGRLDAQFDQFNGPIYVNVSAGRVQLDLPETTGFTLNANVSHGNVSCDLPLKKTIVDDQDHIKGRHGSGEYKVDVRVSNGNIHVE